MKLLYIDIIVLFIFAIILSSFVFFITKKEVVDYGNGTINIRKHYYDKVGE